jgi:signal transduction histidine kinase
MAGRQDRIEIERITAELSRVLTQVERAGTARRQEAGKRRLDLADLELCDLAARTVARSGRAVTPDPIVSDAVVRADPVRVRQCLLALLQNAFRYGGKTVTLRIEPSAGGCRLTLKLVVANGGGAR